MIDRRRAMITDCRAVVGARRMRAESDHAEAMREQAAAAAAAKGAADALTRATEDWTRQMVERFDPMIGTLLASEVLIRAAAADAADNRERMADEERDRAAQEWRAEDARWRVLDDEVATARRRASRSMDERQLAALADRETYARVVR